MNEYNTPFIIGAGWAGLSAGIYLSQAGYSPTLFESAPQAGGRARSVYLTPHLKVDNGQHLLLGAYREYLQLCQLLSLSEKTMLLRQPLQLLFRTPHHPSREIHLPAFLPSPLHLLWGLLIAQGYSFTEKYAVLSMMSRLLLHDFTLSSDCSVQKLLHTYQQPVTIIQYLWQPLCLAALNTPLHLASAQVFLNVLKSSFIAPQYHSNTLLIRQPLSDSFVTPAIQYIQQHQAKLLLRHKVTQLHITDKTVCGISVNQQFIPCSQVILATPAHITRRLLAPHKIFLQALTQQLAALSFEPIYTAYFQYPEHITLPEYMSASIATLGQWYFDRRHCQQPGMIAIVISSQGHHTTFSSSTLLTYLEAELQHYFPALGKPLQRFLIKEQRATFSCQVNIQHYRPQQITPVKGLYLSGDYTLTPYPATLESAILSARLASQALATEH